MGVDVPALHLVVPEGLEDVQVRHGRGPHVQLEDSVRSVVRSEELSLHVLVRPALVLQYVGHLLVRLHLRHLPAHLGKSLNYLLRSLVYCIAIYFDVINNISSMIANIRELFYDSIKNSYLSLSEAVYLLVVPSTQPSQEDRGHLSLDERHLLVLVLASTDYTYQEIECLIKT